MTKLRKRLLPGIASLLIAAALLLALPIAANAEGESQEEYYTVLRGAGFPESYLPSLWSLHQQYPAWEFRTFQTGVDWETAVSEENALGKSLVWREAPSSWKSTQDGAYNWTDSTWVELDSGGWVAASREIIAHYMDPRNFLNGSSVFQFLYQGFDGAAQTAEGLTAMVQGTFLANTELDTDFDGSNGVNTYVSTLYEAGTVSGVSPYILASMMVQEMGTSGASGSISGTNGRFPGVYNAFNIGAYAADGFSAVERGLWYASGGSTGSTTGGRPWTTLYKAILGGAQYYANSFVLRGQNTLYLKRFNVQGESMYRNQYMTNVAGADSEGKLLASAYGDASRALPLVFSIPVYLNMPGAPCAAPGADGSPNAKLASLTVSAGVLSPEFDRDTAAYTLIVPNETASLTVSAQPISAGASVSGTGAIELPVGESTATLTVRAENGASESYTIRVIRQESAGPVSFTGSCTFRADGRVTGIQPGTGTDAFLASLGVNGGTASLTASDGAAKSGDTVVGTGDVLTITYDNNGVPTVYGQYAVLIFGDVNGDGTVQINDLIKIRNHLLGTGTLTGLSLAAADVSRDGAVQINDLIKIRNHLLGTAILQ